MSYLKIPNLYQDQRILQFRECYALEKIHGTSAHVLWKDGRVIFFSGGATYAVFIALFHEPTLAEKFTALGHPLVCVYGEAYGGKCQHMTSVYGPHLKFVAFEVKIGDCWLGVPKSADVSAKLGFDFVPYRRVPTDLAALDAERDAPSEQGIKLGMGEHAREGVVLRSPFEVYTSIQGHRIIAKHKSDAFRETKTPRVVDADKQTILTYAQDIADEWVTPMRLTHVLDAFPPDVGIESTGDVIRAMIKDVVAEGFGEIVMSKEASQAIGRATAKFFKSRLQERMKA